MGDDIVQFKVCLSNELVERVKTETDLELKEVVRNSVLQFLNTYATRQITNQYVKQTEDLLEKYFDPMFNLLGSLSYVSKFNNNILNSIFVDRFDSETQLEEFYNEATETVQKYFQFDDDKDTNLLPLMEENDRLKMKVQKLEKLVAELSKAKSGNQVDVTIGQLADQIKVLEQRKNNDEKKRDFIVWIKTNKKHNEASREIKIESVQEAIERVSQQLLELQEQQEQMTKWVNGLIDWLKQNDDDVIQAYIRENPKPKGVI